MADEAQFHRDDTGAATALLADALEGPSRWQQLNREELGFEVGPRPEERRRLGIFRRVEPTSVASIRPAGDFVGVLVQALHGVSDHHLAGHLTDRGLVLPSTFRLIVDVGDMAGWLAPRSTPHGELLAVAMAGVEAADGIRYAFWRARIAKTGPLLPGFFERRS